MFAAGDAQRQRRHAVIVQRRVGVHEHAQQRRPAQNAVVCAPLDVRDETAHEGQDVARVH